MNIKLEDCILITPLQYMELENPKFEGQTRLDDNNMYFMVFSDNGKLYKIHNHL